jgi:thiamine biosynthesis lipoprotein
VKRTTWLWLAILFLGCGGGRYTSRSSDYKETRWVMGTYVNLVIVDAGEASPQAAARAAFEAIEQWDRILNNYDETTPLSRINAAAPEWTEVPELLCWYLTRARDDSRRTDGAFDLTAGGGVVGMEKVELDCQGLRARLPARGMLLDPGGDGKGVALDAAIAVLRANGVKSALFDFGGSSWSGIGKPRNATAWLVRVEGVEEDSFVNVFLNDRALSVSSARRRREDGSAGAPHIVDPTTGELVQERRVTAAVSESAIDAEVLSTALIVRGAVGFGWLERFEGIEAWILEADGEILSAVSPE